MPSSDRLWAVADSAKKACSSPTGNMTGVLFVQDRLTEAFPVSSPNTTPRPRSCHAGADVDSLLSIRNSSAVRHNSVFTNEPLAPGTPPSSVSFVPLADSQWKLSSSPRSGRASPLICRQVGDLSACSSFLSVDERVANCKARIGPAGDLKKSPKEQQQQQQPGLRMRKVNSETSPVAPGTPVQSKAATPVSSSLRQKRPQVPLILSGSVGKTTYGLPSAKAPITPALTDGARTLAWPFSPTARSPKSPGVRRNQRRSPCSAKELHQL
eukprot:TRINITY_DN2248_c0_g1_i1.p1 TRINITY_DN2248_c0_g1~~TRINITY_DN2248_c0_g1_i1.p1  ORF type:complete len:268 (-),score=37.13 TRINITY_DN2248_c0_g1_i1:1493-2296(-)